jgi:NAD(P)-dependent dehydrogenase (short-subunit alcohol dehydrogenase family)
MDVQGRTALVTGAGGGIGAGIAQALSEAGARVVLADIEPGWAAEHAALLGGETLAVRLDVTSPQSWSEVTAAAEARFGPIEILCNNAGLSMPRVPLDELDEATFARLMAVNVTGVYNGIRACVPGMKARRAGHVVNTSSVNGLVPFGTFAAYSASKFAVTGLSEALHQELAPCGVGVSILYPGLTRSRMSLSPDVGAGGGQPISPEIEALMMEPIWLGRAVVRAIAGNMLHIVTHPHYLPGIEARHAALVASFGEPAQPGYAGGSTRG